MNTLRLFVGALLLTSLGACEPVNIRSDYDRAFDFTTYKTFSWISAEPMIIASPEVSPLAKKRIQDAIVRTLESKGIRFVDAAAADFVVAFTVGMRQQLRVNTTPAYPYPRGYLGPRDWGTRYYQNVDVRDYTQGRLAIDVFDSKTKQPVWTGVGTKGITGADQAHPQELIDKAVTSILADFPPRTTR